MALQLDEAEAKRWWNIFMPSHDPDDVIFLDETAKSSSALRRCAPSLARPSQHSSQRPAWRTGSDGCGLGERAAARVWRCVGRACVELRVKGGSATSRSGPFVCVRRRSGVLLTSPFCKLAACSLSSQLIVVSPEIARDRISHDDSTPLAGDMTRHTSLRHTYSYTQV